MKPLLLICGPTACHKSETALRLGERWGGEILSIDSVAVYQGMDIGSAKPDILERQRVPHHLIDIVDPDDTGFSVAAFQQAADVVLRDLDRVTALDIELFLEHMSLYTGVDERERENNERAKARKLSAIRSFFKYYHRQELIKNNPASLVDTPKIHEKAIIRLEANEVADLLDIAEAGNGLSERQKAYHEATKVRDTAILTLFLGTGIRISELVGIDIDDVYQSYRQNAQQKGIRLELDMEEDLPDVISDPDRIEQVLVILLDNAMRYAGEGGTVRISAHQDTSDVHVSVWDSGCGIAPEDMVHVFERFFKTDKSRKEGGTGLGLSIAKQIMDKLDEQITVQSEVGKWTCFTFTVKKYVSNAIALGPVDETAIVYNELNTEPGRTAGEKDSMDAPFEVLKEDKKADKARFKGRVIKKKESK